MPITTYSPGSASLMRSYCALNHLATVQMSGAEDARLNAGLKKESKLSVTEEEHNVQSRQEAG